MRTEQNWEENILLERVIKHFSPRIQRDLSKWPKPKTPPIDNYYIYGPTGSGKTVYAAWILLEQEKQIYLNNEPKTCRFIIVPELFTSIKKYYDEKQGKSEHQLLEELSEVYLLVLDDFGIDKPTDWLICLLYLLINRRYENLLPTIITSNLNLEEMANRLQDDRITHRIEREYKKIELTKTYK